MPLDGKEFTLERLQGRKKMAGNMARNRDKPQGGCIIFLLQYNTLSGFK